VKCASARDRHLCEIDDGMKRLVLDSHPAEVAGGGDAR